MSASASALSMPGLSILLLSALPSTSDMSMLMPGSSALLSSALPSAFGVSVPVPGLSALLSSALPSPSSVSLPLPGLLALPSVSSVSSMSVLMPRLLAPPSVSGVPIPVPGLCPPPFPTWSDLQTPMPFLGRQRLSQWSEILKRASSKKAPTTCVLLFPPSECPSPLLFLSSGISKKPPFDKAFNIDCRPLADDQAGKDAGQRKFDKSFINIWALANNHTEEEVDLSFAGCEYSLGFKLNRPWQIELLEQRLACIVETILLAVAIFWDPNFVYYLRYMLNLAIKMGLKTRNLSSTLVKEHIQLIWANKIIGQLDALFKENPDWWNATAVIYSQPLIKNVKK